MNVQAFALVVLVPLLLQGAPYHDPKDQISVIRNDLRNLEVEFQQLKERVSNQDVALDTVQADVAATTKAQKNQTVDSKLGSLLTEVKSIKSHANKLLSLIHI